MRSPSSPDGQRVAPGLPAGVRGLRHPADDPAVVAGAVWDSLRPHDNAGAEPRLDRVAFLRSTRKLDLLEILEVRPFDHQNELLQLVAARGSPRRTSCNSSSSKHLLPPDFVVADRHVATGTPFFVSIS